MDFLLNYQLKKRKNRGITIEEKIEDKIAQANLQHSALSRQTAASKFKGD
jgi:hypothetical protein